MVVAVPAVQKVFDAFRRAGEEVYLVGGTVRDILIGKTELNDFDFAVSTKPDQTNSILRKAGMKTFSVGPAFGTVGAVADGCEMHLTTYRRKEQYKPRSRHPDVEFGGTIEEDLSRRDFCMNAIAMDAKGSLIDPFDGRKDIENKVISAPGDAEDILSEDPLRLLRVARFVSLLGFDPLPELAETARDLAFLIVTVSVERWKMEMDKFVLGDYVDKGMDYMILSSLFTFMMPEVINLRGFNQGDEYHHKDLWEHTKHAMSSAPKDVDVRWALMLHDIGKPYTKSVVEGKVHFYRHELVGEILARSVMFRLRFPGAQRKKVQNLISNHMRPNLYDDSWTDSAVRRLVKDARGDIDDLLAVSRADITSKRAETVRRGMDKLDKLTERITALAEKEKLDRVLPRGMGHAIMERLNLGEGPQVGAIIKALEEAVMAGELEPQMEPDYYIEYLKQRQQTDTGA